VFQPRREIDDIIETRPPITSLSAGGVLL